MKLEKEKIIDLLVKIKNEKFEKIVEEKNGDLLLYIDKNYYYKILKEENQLLKTIESEIVLIYEIYEKEIKTNVNMLKDEKKYDSIAEFSVNINDLFSDEENKFYIYNYDNYYNYLYLETHYLDKINTQLNKEEYELVKEVIINKNNLKIKNLLAKII